LSRAPAYRLHIRSYPEGGRVSIWIIRTEKGKGRRGILADAGLLWGELLPQTAEELAAALGLPVTRENQPTPSGDSPPIPPGCATIPEQRDLFGGQP